MTVAAASTQCKKNRRRGNLGASLASTNFDQLIEDRLNSMLSFLRRHCPLLFPCSRCTLPKSARRHLVQMGPLLLLFVLIVYLIMGAAAFLFLEHSEHEHTVRRFYFQLAVSRRQFARKVAATIFSNPNSAAQSLIIVDRANVERIQSLLAHSLKEYEQQLALQLPNRYEWTWGNSLNYAWGLLTTVGHGNRSPKTWGGQVFALWYCLLGVPYFVLCLIAVGYRMFCACKSSRLLCHCHLTLLLASILAYVAWLLLFSSLLHLHSIPESFWRSLYTAALSSLTIQTADYNAFGEEGKLLALACTTVSLQLACVVIFLLTGYYRRRCSTSSSVGSAGANNKVASGSLKNSEGAGSKDGLQLPSSLPARPAVQIIVNEVGDNRVRTLSPSKGELGKKK